MTLAPISPRADQFHLNPVLGVVDALPTTGLSNGDRYAVKSTPPTIQVWSGSAWVTKAVPEGAQFTVAETNQQWQRNGDNLELTNASKPILFRGELDNYQLSSVSPVPALVAYPDIGSFHPYFLPFQLAGNAPLRGVFSSGEYTATSSEALLVQVAIQWKIHTSFYPVQYVVIEESVDGVIWAIKDLLWQESPSIHWYQNNLILDLIAGRRYRVVALLSEPPHIDVEIVRSYITTGVGSLLEQEAIANAPQILLPAIISQATFSNQNVNFIDISYDITIAPNSLPPTSVEVRLFENGNLTAIATQTISPVPTPNSTTTVTFANIDGFNGAVPKIFEPEVEVA